MSDNSIESLKDLESGDLGEVKCLGCGLKVGVNSIYLRYIRDMEIKECSKCRSKVK